MRLTRLVLVCYSVPDSCRNLPVNSAICCFLANKLSFLHFPQVLFARWFLLVLLLTSGGRCVMSTNFCLQRHARKRAEDETEDSDMSASAAAAKKPKPDGVCDVFVVFLFEKFSQIACFYRSTTFCFFSSSLVGCCVARQRRQK